MRDPRDPYDESLTRLSPEQNAAAETWFDAIQAGRLQVSEHDEEPDFDIDDALEIAAKALDYKSFIAPFVGVSDAELAENIEKVVHGVMSNLQPFGSPADPE